MILTRDARNKDSNEFNVDKKWSWRSREAVWQYRFFMLICNLLVWTKHKLLHCMSNGDIMPDTSAD